MLIWKLVFIRKTGAQQEIMISKTFENGQPVDQALSDVEIIFLNYISLFPAKDIVRITLSVEGAYLYTFYYIDKTHFHLGFLGVMGVSEYNEAHPYEWPETEFIAKYIFAEYMKRLKSGEITEPAKAQEYLDWVDENIKEFYDQFLEAKKEYVKKKVEDSKGSLFSVFQSAAAKKEALPSNGKVKEISSSRKSTKESKKRKELREIKTIKKQSKTIRLREITPKKLPEGKPINLRDKEEIKWMRMRRRFEFMLINSFGNPLTRIMSFINGKQVEWGSEQEQTTQSLEGMVYSVLKGFVEEQKLNLKNMLVRKPNGEGYEYILFKHFKMGEMSYLIIMNVDNYDPELGRSIDKLKGDEETILNRIAEELIANKKWFNERGEFVSPKIAYEVESVFYRQCKRAFK